MSNIHYSRHWSRHDKEPGPDFSEAEARAAYDNRTLHTALIGDKDRPRCFVESNMDYVGVDFLDEHLRDYIGYSFQERRPGRLFLSMAVYRWYHGDEDKVAGAVVYYYQEDGAVRVHKNYLDTKETWEANVQLDLSANWERYPEFGKYESITRLNRGLDLVHTQDFRDKSPGQS